MALYKDMASAVLQARSFSGLFGRTKKVVP